MCRRRPLSYRFPASLPPLHLSPPQSDPVEFWSWLLNNLHLDLTGGKPKKPSIITQCLQVGSDAVVGWCL